MKQGPRVRVHRNAAGTPADRARAFHGKADVRLPSNAVSPLALPFRHPCACRNAPWQVEPSVNVVLHLPHTRIPVLLLSPEFLASPLPNCAQHTV
jgi:hypothetical protein